ncbi:MAG: hypothetical protein KDD50_02010 [Bdellovibrionales bacterium]|nr:hypothetical protein [Bdellovibrionales bacterium]
MSNNLHWAKSLNISEDQINQWQNELPDGEDLLFWVISHQLIDEQEYLHWAQQTLHLAQLNKEFLKEYESYTPPAYLKSLNYWSRSVCPIAEWDGTVFVACLYPPEDLVNQQNIRFVLSPLTLLEQLWSHFNNTNVHEEFNELPPTPDKQTQVTFIPESIPESSHEDSIEILAEEDKGVDEVIDFEASAENEEDLSSTRSSLPMAAQTMSEETTEEPNAVTSHLQKVIEPQDLLDPERPLSSTNSSLMPEGLDVDQIGSSPAPADLDPGEALFFHADNDNQEDPSFNGEDLKSIQFESPEGILGDNIPAGGQSQSPEGLGDLHRRPKDNIFTFPSDKAPQADSPSFTEVSDDEDATTTMNLAQQKEQDLEKTAPVASASEPPNKIYKGPAHFEDCQSFDEVVEWVFHQSKQYYKSSMLLQFERGKPKAWKWDSQWKDQGQSSILYDLSTPSIFRILTQTRKPFHGPIRPSPVNDQFFQAWGYTDLPSVVTAIPIKKYKRISAILLCVGDKHAEDIEALKLVLSLGDKISEFLKVAQKRVG